MKQSVNLCDRRMFLFVPNNSDIATKITQHGILKMALQNFQGFRIDNLLLLDERFLQTCEYQSFGENTKVQKIDNCRRHMDYERYESLDF